MIQTNEPQEHDPSGIFLQYIRGAEEQVIPALQKNLPIVVREILRSAQKGDEPVDEDRVTLLCIAAMKLVPHLLSLEARQWPEDLIRRRIAEKEKSQRPLVSDNAYHNLTEALKRRIKDGVTVGQIRGNVDRDVQELLEPRRPHSVFPRKGKTQPRIIQNPTSEQMQQWMTKNQ